MRYLQQENINIGGYVKNGTNGKRDCIKEKMETIVHIVLIKKY